MNQKLTITLFIGFAALACAKPEAPVAESKPVPAAAAQKAAAVAPAASEAAAPAASAPAAGAITGSIAETMDAGGYTYMKLQTATGETWVATPQVAVKKGQTISVHPQMSASKFASATLGRTFDSIVFATLDAPSAAAPVKASAIPPVGKPAAAPKMPADPQAQQMMMSAMGMPADHMKPKVDVGEINVPKAEGANAYTVSGLWASRAKVSGTEIVVRGKVVKFSGDIMGTNFVHLRDGSGSESTGDHDLTVTTNEIVVVGDVVTIRGSVSTEKDFGAGYKYPVIVENAKVVK